MLDKYLKDNDHNLGIQLQYANHSQWIHRATLPMGINNRGKEEKGKKRKVVPKTATA